MPDRPIDLDLRKLRYFVAVAERRHFGQAAVALHVTQPALSRQVRQLEHELRVELFTRSTREVSLTPAGEQFLRDAKALLAAAEAAQERARRIGAGDDALVVGFMLGTDVSLALNAFSARFPRVSIELVRLRWWSQARAILDGSVDVGFVRPPLEADGVDLLALYAEHLAAVLPIDHPRARDAKVDLAALTDDPVLEYAEAAEAWSAVWNADPRPDGTRPGHGPAFHDMEELLGYVRGGRGIAFVPSSVAAAFPRSDIAYVPVADVPPGPVSLAWNSSRPSHLVTSFVDTVHAAVRARGTT
ncbi:LysR substrate-binding domain-containing protein [Streptomyces sp. NPDC093982]|jgi:DNA-binding transcriptional LysR family regulator|uniref:LysR family transcriptional regulator n=1 Tax=Streptomyces sp. NPDC093982 TaxID=3155077 RepID=UPI00343E619E